MTGRVCALGSMPHYIGGRPADAESLRGALAAMLLRVAAIWLLVAVPFLASSIAAANAADGAPDAVTSAEAPLDVVVTIKPIHSLVAQVMEGVGQPSLLVEGSASPHSFSLKPSQVAAINRATVFFRVSEWLEPFTGKVVRALPASVELVTLMDTPGLKLLPRRKTGTFEPHDHAGEHSHHHDSDHGHHHSHDDVGSSDSHIWLDPQNAKHLVSYIADVLSKHYPAHAAKFAVNAEAAHGRIDALAAELESDLRAVKDRPFIVFHDAYQYFDVRFALNAVGSITVSPDVRPSAKRLSELRRRIRSLKAACVFAEPMYQPRLVEAVIEGTDARSGTLDPEGMLLKPGPDLYEKLMRNLAADLNRCLANAASEG
ncbi:zinc ABC transporter substrate-binding protein [Hyphomicrobium sp. D-2]|uniref:zinc ABC transporter substrate-binding protein n=1 Tax=Hyphomicrobium sp. D-2 TaxID=3041621 RepID=UPI00245666FD|nr:zinc ABC transporter substrate-binding protein [Hyphomicrobium sp. D-2]MDH4982569.1 zinc ABC transporter substrate-binding protein [Hyphomicrobium sp. D-2]